MSDLEKTTEAVETVEAVAEEKVETKKRGLFGRK